jgi:hypothetical protein
MRCQVEMEWLVDEEDRLIRLHLSPVIALRDAYFFPEQCVRLAHRFGNGFVGPTLIYHRDTLEATGRCDPAYMGLPDLLMALIVASRRGVLPGSLGRIPHSLRRQPVQNLGRQRERRGDPRPAAQALAGACVPVFSPAGSLNAPRFVKLPTLWNRLLGAAVILLRLRLQGRGAYTNPPAQPRRVRNLSALAMWWRANPALRRLARLAS